MTKDEMPNRIRKLRIIGFRGVRFELPLDFTKDCRSIAIYGENAAGKSTITDAIEWFVTNRVDHLWREDCKEEALRNILIPPDQDAEVSIEFSGGEFTGTKLLNAALSAKSTNNNAEFREFLDGLASDRLMLRHSQIVDFVAKSKADKRKEIASIIGYDDVVRFRDVIQQALNALRKDTGYTTAKAIADQRRTDLIKIVGSAISTENELLGKANELLAPYGLAGTVTDRKTYKQAAENLLRKISQLDKAHRKVTLGQLKTALESVASNVAAVFEKEESFVPSYNAIVAGKDTVAQLNLEDFLTAGKGLIEEGHVTEQKCPFCLTPYSLEKLREEVAARAETIGTVRTKYEEVETPKAAFIQALNKAKSSCDEIVARYAAREGYEKVAKVAEQCGTALQALVSDVSKAYEAFKMISLPEAEKQALKDLALLATQHAQKADTEASQLEFTKEEQQIIDASNNLRDLEKRFDEYTENQATKKAFEEQILTLSALFESFLKEQAAALQDVLDVISHDVGAYYTKLHPSENIDQVRLNVVGEEGVEFEYYFHGKHTHPPMKYLSESHLNSLGIVLFLAYAKVMNKKSRFLVLDDVVTSFDLGHRRRLLRLIRDDFADWQVLLLTHESFWFDMIKKELNPKGWLLKEVSWDVENGVQLTPSTKDMKELIQVKRAKYDVSNDLRKLLEATLKEICFSLAVKVAFRYNEHNERRMSGELLSELKSTINRKCPALKGHAIFASLEGSNLVATVGSHDNPESPITGGDIDVALDDIDTLEGIFRCGKCGGYALAENVVQGQDKVTCKCGFLQTEWKQ